MRRGALLALLLLTGCAGHDATRSVLGDVPRDARGEPVFSAIAPPATAAQAAYGDAPPPAAAPVESCRHRRRCP